MKLFIGILFSALIIIFFINFILKAIYTSFVKKYSVGYKTISEINAKYYFKQYSDVFYSYKYDNEKFYNSISCDDFLVYELAYYPKRIKECLNYMQENQSLLEIYSKEIDSSYIYGEYIKSTNNYIKKKLDKLELKMIKKIVFKPKVDLKCKVTLSLSTINGRIYSKKYSDFNAKEIRYRLTRLSNKKNGYFLDREMWESICRVERGKVSNKMRFSIYKRDGYRCKMCGRSDRFAYLEIDHIKPIAKGGKSIYSNLQTLCSKCNAKKGDSY